MIWQVLFQCLQTMLQIWDAFLYEGSKVLFRYAIALFKFNEEQLLKLDSTSAIFNQVRRIGKLAYDPQRLSQVSTAYYPPYHLPLKFPNSYVCFLGISVM